MGKRRGATAGPKIVEELKVRAGEQTETQERENQKKRDKFELRIGSNTKRRGREDNAKRWKPGGIPITQKKKKLEKLAKEKNGKILCAREQRTPLVFWAKTQKSRNGNGGGVKTQSSQHNKKSGLQ